MTYQALPVQAPFPSNVPLNPVVTVPAVHSDEWFPQTLAGKNMFRISINVMVLVLLSMLVEVFGVLWAYDGSASLYGGFWNFPFGILSASFGMAAGRSKRDRCLINTHMVFSIIESVGAATVLSTAIVIVSSSFSSNAEYEPDINMWIYNYDIAGILTGFIQMTLSLATLILSIISSTYACKSTCCYNVNHISFSPNQPILTGYLPTVIGAQGTVQVTAVHSQYGTVPVAASEYQQKHNDAPGVEPA